MYKGKSSAAASTGDAAGKTAGANGDTPAPFPSQTSGRPVSLIDYEYSGYNPRGFDVGNHFCEWMADYAAEESHKLDLERYPSMEERRRYCRAYLGTINGVSFCLSACLPSPTFAQPATKRCALDCPGTRRALI